MESKYELPAKFEDQFTDSFVSFIYRRFPQEYPDYNTSTHAIREFLAFLSKPPDLDSNFETAIQAKLIQDALFNQARGCRSLYDAGISTSPGQARFIMQNHSGTDTTTVIVDSYNRNNPSRDPLMAIGYDAVLAEREEGNVARFVRPVHTPRGIILADQVYEVHTPQAISRAFIHFWNTDPQGLFPMQLEGSPIAEELYNQYGRLFTLPIPPYSPHSP